MPNLQTLTYGQTLGLTAVLFVLLVAEVTAIYLSLTKRTN